MTFVIFVYLCTRRHRNARVACLGYSAGGVSVLLGRSWVVQSFVHPKHLPPVPLLCVLLAGISELPKGRNMRRNSSEDEVLDSPKFYGSAIWCFASSTAYKIRTVLS